ncbi:MAG: hypothetical protein ACE5H4_14705 [Candidatus Thorarchaeota archaeon]
MQKVENSFIFRTISVFEYIDRLESIVGPRSSVLVTDRGTPRAEVLIFAIDELSERNDQDAFEYLKRILTSEWTFSLKWPRRIDLRWGRFDPRWNSIKQTEITSEIHGRCLAALEGMDNPAVPGLALDYLNGLRWHATWEEGCKSQAYLEGSSLDTVEIAERIVLKNNPESMIPIYRRFLETLVWDDPVYHRGTLGEWAAKGLAGVLRGDAVDELLKHFDWYHATFQCVFERPYYDSRIIDAIVSIGEDAVPSLLELVLTEDGNIVLDMLRRIGGNSADLLVEYLRDGFRWEYTGAIKAVADYLAEENHPSALDMTLIGSLFCGSASEQRELLESLNLKGEDDAIIERLKTENRRVQNGVTSYFRIFPNMKALGPLLDLAASHVERGWLLRHEFISDREWPEETYVDTAIMVDELGEDAVAYVGESLQDERASYRAAAMMILGTVATHKKGEDLLKASGLRGFLEGFFDDELKSDGPLENLREEIHGYGPPYSREWKDRVVYLSKHRL